MPETHNIPTIHKGVAGKPAKRARLTVEDAENIAQIVAKRVTETGACAILGIKFATWAQWKMRNANKFDELLARIKEQQIYGHMQAIEAAQVKDWRASDRLLQIKAPERFGAKGEPQQVNVSVVAEPTLLRALQSAYGQSQQALAAPGQSSVDVEVLPPESK